ncbi:tRNA binding domain protein, partial [Opisthorchis viverrini]
KTVLFKHESTVSAEIDHRLTRFCLSFPLSRTGLLIPGHSGPYHDYSSLEADYLSGHVDSDALKQAVVKCLNSRMDVIRADFNTPEMARLVEQAYPSSEANGLSNGVENLSVDSNEPTNGSSSGIPEKLSTLEEQLAPIGDRSSLLSALREEFPDAGDQLTTCVRRVDRLRCLWSVTPTGLPHLGHSIPLRKLARLSQFDGVHIVVLVNNVAAHLRGSCSWDLVVPRGEFCRAVLSALFIALGGRREQFTCLLGTDFQYSGDYMLEFYRLVSLVPESDCAAASDCPTSVAEQQENDTSTNDPSADGGSARCALGQLLMPCTDLVDTVYLRAHVRLASADRVRKRHLFEKGFLSKLTSQQAPVHLSHPLLSSLQVDSTGSVGTSVTVVRPMHSCPPASRTECPAAAQALAILAEDCSLPLVEPLAPGAEKTVLQGLKRRLKRAFCQPGNVAVNPVLEIYRYVILPDVSVAAPLIIPRSEKNGGPLHICSPDGAVDCTSRWVALQTAFAQEILHPGDLKPAAELALSPANPESVASRLLQALPPWPQLMQLLDAAFPQPVKQTTGKGKTKGKKGTNSGDGDAVCNGHSTAKGDATSQQTTGDTVDPNRLEIRVGRIITAKKHPDADSLYVEEVDFGPTLGHRTVISGLAGLYPLELLQGRCGAFVTNLKPVRMRGLESQ